MSTAADLAGFVAGSRYRRAVCTHLNDEGASIPSDIADATGIAQPHVSRALSELRDRSAVELLVPESTTKGRLYGLTSTGERALTLLRRRKPELSVTVVEDGTFPAPELLARLRERHDADLRAVGVRDPAAETVAFDGQVDSTYGHDVLERIVDDLWGAPVPRDRDAPAGRESRDSAPTEGECRFVSYGFAEATVIRVIAESREVALALASDFDGTVRQLARTCLETV